MTDERIVKLEAALRVQAALTADAQAQITRYLSKEIELHSLTGSRRDGGRSDSGLLMTRTAGIGAGPIRTLS